MLEHEKKNAIDKNVFLKKNAEEEFDGEHFNALIEQYREMYAEEERIAFLCSP